MSKYTTQVRFVCESLAGKTESVGGNGIAEVIASAVPKIFDFEFPIFDESYRNVLCTKILKHYYTREICEETVGLWKFRLDCRLNEIMPYYNQLYKSEALEFNPLYDVDYTRSGNREHEGSDKLTSNKTKNITDNLTKETDVSETNVLSKTDAENGSTTIENSQTSNASTTATETNERTDKDLYSDTPQGALTGVDNETYLTNARKKIGEGSNTNSGTSTGTTTGDYSESRSNNVTVNANDTKNGNIDESSNRTIKDVDSGSDNREINTTDEYLERISGKTGSVSYSKMLMEYRKSFLNIDMMVINALADLFFNLW